jgi:diguanylate cyclase
MDNSLRILFVDDEPIDVRLEQYELEREGLSFSGRTASSDLQLRSALVDFQPDIVLCDYSIPGYCGLRALATVQQLRPETPVLMVSGAIADETAIECLNSGATDYLLKSNLRRLGPAVRRAVDNVRERRALRERIEHLSNYDTVTGLPNLARVNHLVCSCLDRAREERTMAALVLIDLDQSRRIDEAFARRIADDALRDVGVTLNTQSRGCEFVARMGPNEFLLVLMGFASAQLVGVQVQGLLDSIAVPHECKSREPRLRGTAGIAVYPADGTEIEELLPKASAALHEAKLISPGGMQFHSGNAVQHASERYQLAANLRDAIDHDALCLFYQPQFQVRSGEVCGVEALARWFCPDGTSIAPSVFVPLAEQTGLIGSIGSWALHRGCSTAAEWLRADPNAPVMSINVSTNQICDAFTQQLEGALELTGLPARQLELEITETSLIQNIERAAKYLTAWKRMGVGIALDDFGTGYSSLGYLSKLPIDRLKIDGSLIRGMTVESRVCTIVRTIISLGKELGYTVLAEGVETERQLGMLDSLGCEQAQGFLLSPPRSRHDVRGAMSHLWGGRVFGPRQE